MKLVNFTRKLKKVYQIGPFECKRILFNRMMIKSFASKHKQAALAKNAATTWDVFIKTHPEFTFKSGFNFLDMLAECIDEQDVIKHANNVLQNKIQLFEQEFFFEGVNRWHTDFILKKENELACSFDPEVYFDDIKITAGKTQERVKDIRVVWELSRLHVLMPLGKAYALIGNTEYVDYFYALILDWSAQNPYLLGVNWVCPMEVGIRAINLIVGYSYFKDADIDQTFWQKYICLLYDHMRYLEHTWEYYDGRTSNHYLSDLIGYFYLCVFFEKKLDWVIKEIVQECDKQILLDGMSYEGSTAYHVLVTELFSLFMLLCEQENIYLPQTFYQKFERMCLAIKACKINAHEMITIGDNDSGKVLWTGFVLERFLKTHINLPQERTNFDRFGLAIMQKEGWHVSLRKHSYMSHQPSGHFHNDIGSVTLALNGIPILIDPGSYCYTASAFWRNYFRSASVHNAISIQGKEPVEFDERLFVLNLREQVGLTDENKEILYSSHQLYEKEQLNFERTVELQKNNIFITDIVTASSPKLEDFLLFFNFTFAQQIDLKKMSNGWLILYNNEPICIFETDLSFELKQGWVSHNYGSKILTKRLCAESLWQKDRAYICRFKRLKTN